MELVTRKQAKEKGLVRYYTGKPCKRGHVSERNTKQGHCLECNVFHGKEYYKANPEKQRDRNLRYKAKYPEKAKEKAKNDYFKLKEKHGGVVPLQTSPEKRKAATKKYSLINKDRLSDYNRRWRKQNKDKHNAKAARYRARKLNASPYWLGEDDRFLINEIYELAKIRTEMTGITWHVDHIIPLNGRLVSGLHVPMNLQVIPAHENFSKTNSFGVAV